MTKWEFVSTYLFVAAILRSAQSLFCPHKFLPMIVFPHNNQVAKLLFCMKHLAGFLLLLQLPQAYMSM